MGGEEGGTPSTCSLGNLSNLKSCQDAERLCKALPLPFPSPPLYKREREEENPEDSKKSREMQTERERGCHCVMFFVLIQGKLTLRADRTSYQLLGFCRPPRGFGSGGFALSSPLSHNSSTLDPLFSQLLSVNVKAPFPCQIRIDSCGTASFEVCWTL